MHRRCSYPEKPPRLRSRPRRRSEALTARSSRRLRYCSRTEKPRRAGSSTRGSPGKRARKSRSTAPSKSARTPSMSTSTRRRPPALAMPLGAVPPPLPPGSTGESCRHRYACAGAGRQGAAAAPGPTATWERGRAPPALGSPGKSEEREQELLQLDSEARLRLPCCKRDKGRGGRTEVFASVRSTNTSHRQGGLRGQWKSIAFLLLGQQSGWQHLHTAYSRSSCKELYPRCGRGAVLEQIQFYVLNTSG